MAAGVFDLSDWGPASSNHFGRYEVSSPPAGRGGKQDQKFAFGINSVYRWTWGHTPIHLRLYLYFC